ncbi:MAG: nucleoside kinase, partial [Clostridium sp.]
MNIFSIMYEGKNIEVKEGTTFKELINDYTNENYHGVALCRLNEKYYELSTVIKTSGELELMKFNSTIGMKIYSRTLQFIFIKASLDIFENSKITIEHSISKGLFGEIHKEEALCKSDIDKIKIRMKEIIKKDVPINKLKVKREEAIRVFEGYGMDDKVSLLNHVDFENVNLYELEGRYDYFYGQMAYSTGSIRAFNLREYAPGFVIENPMQSDLDKLPPYENHKKLSQIFLETEKWLNILGVGEVGSLNDKVQSNELNDLIMVSEALHEKKIAHIADMIKEKSESKVVLIAGPTSSGKTTFANRLGVQLRVNGFIPIRVSLDDYFVNRDMTPKDEDGQLDFESIYALDLKLFNEHLNLLLDGQEVEIPSYNFKIGEREWLGEKLKLPPNGILVIEGIHGLNPMLTSSIEDSNKFKIYISALTQLNLDNHNRIATTDIRRLRRIVRDFLSRGYGAEQTLMMWPSIKRGEQKNIFVYQEEADIMFNSTLVYELCVLKKYALQELEKIKPESPIYLEATRLKSFLGFFKEIDKKYVP